MPPRPPLNQPTMPLARDGLPVPGSSAAAARVHHEIRMEMFAEDARRFTEALHRLGTELYMDYGLKNQPVYFKGTDVVVKGGSKKYILGAKVYYDPEKRKIVESSDFIGAITKRDIERDEVTISPEYRRRTAWARILEV